MLYERMLCENNIENIVFLYSCNELESQGALRDRKDVFILSIAVQSNHHISYSQACNRMKMS